MKTRKRFKESGKNFVEKRNLEIIQKNGWDNFSENLESDTGNYLKFCAERGIKPEQRVINNITDLFPKLFDSFFITIQELLNDFETGLHVDYAESYLEPHLKIALMEIYNTYCPEHLEEVIENGF